MSHEPKQNIDFGENWMEQMMKWEKKSLVIVYAEAVQRIIKLEGDVGYLKGLNENLIARNSRLRDIIGEL